MNLAEKWKSSETRKIINVELFDNLQACTEHSRRRLVLIYADVGKILIHDQDPRILGSLNPRILGSKDPRILGS